MNKGNRITGAIFDCDGTLLDSLNAWQGLEGELSQAVRVKVTPEERAQFATSPFLKSLAIFMSILDCFQILMR